MRDLRTAGVAGARITEIEVLRHNSVAPLSPAEFISGAAGRRIGALRRRGKYLLFFLEGGGVLAAHLRMSGSFILADPHTPRDSHDRLVLTLAFSAENAAANTPADMRRELRFHDPRAFGRIRLITDEREVTALLGPEPLDPAMTDSAFHRLLQRRRRLKPLLLDQRVLAGLGNIYTDEALHAAGLHPLRRADTLSLTDASRLLSAIRSVLRGAIERRGTSLGDGEGSYRSAGREGENRQQLSVYGRTGRSCPRCGTAVQRIVVGQRGTHLCPRCQPGESPGNFEEAGDLTG